MFGIGMQEMIMILAIALIVIGPKKLPDLARSLGKAMGEFKKATSDLKETIDSDHSLRDVKQAFSDMNKDIKQTVYTAAAETTSKETERPESSVTEPQKPGPDAKDSNVG
ncbi:MAG: Sec-independent protein translocase protein TatB [Desulfatirhabdiaceae bacterium]